MADKRKKLFLAEYGNPAELINAAEKMRDAGYKEFDCHSPFPIHGMDQAMGLKRSPLGWIVGLSALLGGLGALWLQWWTSSVDYRLIISGKPFFSFQAYVPVTFGGAVLFGAIAAVVGMLILNRLPRLHHPVFNSDRFSRFSDDGFFVSISSDDPKFDAAELSRLFENTGGKNIEVVEY
ncbi:MAG: DUF3341 domain-containing protein [candidate division Zixibacteria bacterium]|nr:DUF3341 domain-containing protein [candidate division Zixibacteria bacterium]